MNIAAGNIQKQVFVSMCVLFLLGVGFLGQIKPMFNLLRNYQTVFHSTLHFYQQCMKVPISPHLAFFFDYSNHNSGYGMVSHCSFDLHFPNDAEYLFMCLLLDIYVSSLDKHLFKYFAHL